MNDFNKYEYKNETGGENNEKYHESYQVETHEPKREYYYETIKNEQEPKRKKTSWLKFIVGVAVASAIGGGAIGASFSFAQPFAQQIIGSRVERDSDATNDQIGEKTVEEKPKFTFADDVRDVATPTIKNSDNAPVVQIAKTVGPSVVSITNTRTVVDYWNREFTSPGLGSGIIFTTTDEKVFIITNSHVVEEATALTVTFLGNTRVPAHLVGNDAMSDIAVVAVNKEEIPEAIREDLKPAPIGDSDTLEVGELAVAIGNPVNEAYHNTITVGVISALNREVQLPGKQLNLIQTDAAINPGNSGGALVGSAGKVIGVNTIKLVDSKIEGMGFAIPINDVKPIVEELMNKGTVVRPYLGIRGTDVTEETAALVEIPIGIYVQEVIEGSGAYAAGIQQGDILIELDGEKISSMQGLIARISEYNPEDKVSVKLVRGRQKKEVTVKLLPQPANIPQASNIPGQ